MSNWVGVWLLALEPHLPDNDVTDAAAGALAEINRSTSLMAVLLDLSDSRIGDDMARALAASLIASPSIR